MADIKYEVDSRFKHAKYTSYFGDVQNLHLNGVNCFDKIEIFIKEHHYSDLKTLRPDRVIPNKNTKSCTAIMYISCTYDSTGAFVTAPTPSELLRRLANLFIAIKEQCQKSDH